MKTVPFNENARDVWHDASVNAMLVLDAIAIAGQALPPGAAASRPKTSPPASERKRQSDKILFLERAVAHHAMDANRFQTLVGLASAVIEAARRLPGLYTVQVDGRPGFTSQAAADLCNALTLNQRRHRTGVHHRIRNRNPALVRRRRLSTHKEHHGEIRNPAWRLP